MDAIQTVVETGQASTSFIQRRFKVGYARAGRIVDQMEERGVISGYQGSKPREVLMTLEKLQELKRKGAIIDSIGLGDNIVAPDKGRVGCVYKNVAIIQNGKTIPKIK